MRFGVVVRGREDVHCDVLDAETSQNPHVDARLTLVALTAAIESRTPPPGCIHHSDSEYLRAGFLGVI